MATGSRVERKKYERKTGRPSSPSPKKKARPKRRKNWIKRFFILLVALFFLAVIGGASLFGYYALNAPKISKSDLQGQVSSKIYDHEGTLIKELGGQNRDLMTKDEMPQVLKDAVLAIEDSRFYSHHGIDPIRIVGALISNIRSGAIREGGSTITQQLVKLSVFSTDFTDQTLERKAQEAWLSLQIEQQYSKDEILTLYLNKLFYSNNVYGAKTATRVFFNKNLADLTLAEAALLAGIPQAPSHYDPYANPTEAKERRDLVLSVMYERGLITQSEYQAAVNTTIESTLVPLDDKTLAEKDLMVDAYIDVVAQEVQEKSNINIYTDGVEVYTNLNMDVQRHLYETVNQNKSVVFPDNSMQTAVSIIDVTTGALQAISGGRKQDVVMGLNRANTLNRSIGSTMKPLADYGPAIEYLNYSTGQLVVDEPMKYSSGADLFNYDFEYKGKMTLREALAGSRNIPALKMLKEVGFDNAYAFLQKLDINILNDNKRQLLEANAIGGEVTPIQLSAAYAAIANYGTYHKPHTVKKIVTAAGTEEVYETTKTQAMKDSTAYMLTDILKGVPGTFATSAAIDGIHHAGKTGTTNYTDEQLKQLGLDSSTYAAPDAWYVGFSPQYAIATWVGYDNPYESGNYLTLEETRIPQLIYKEMMTYLMKNVPVTDWQRPDSVKEMEIEKYTDPLMLPGPYTPAEARSKELFVASSTLPTIQSLAYGQYVDAPTSLTATYNQEKKQIEASWSGNLPQNAVYELVLNDKVVYTGTGTNFNIPTPPTPGNYSLRLRILLGNSSSDTLVFNINLVADETTTSDESTTSVDETTLVPETTLEPPLPSETTSQ
ncbi:transglycosylase domain-containing protein [Tuanshanicoccus lijuaniae]|uniref:transglycosylase domain-containing protein n=1 Tax=Aerococcaceae bacterium zg-1292 TaxID=2774330 RepID=UPI001BD9010D|nr:PBP1A family penicillin-binding protein [Aerococcaceae bacterium zg-A91]MBS4457778.1 PBP1A family penicillin-binding protein [Aerococcaceae bacterium zg-BR33]